MSRDPLDEYFRQEIEDLEGELDDIKEDLAQALEQYDKLAAHVGGCTDGGCLIVRPEGMHTNGGCKCSDDRLKARRMMQAGQMLADAIRKHIT